MTNYKIEPKIEPSTDNYLQNFLTAKRVEGRSPKTIQRYEYEIDKLLSYLNLATCNITTQDLRAYFMYEKEKGLQDKTLEGQRSIFSSYFNWLQREGLIIKNPCANLGTIKYQKQVKFPFSEVDIMLLRESCKNARDKALISFLLCTGCRISELTQLDIVDVNFEQKEVKILGKGNKERIVYLDDLCVKQLKDYLGARKDTSPALFVGKGTNRISSNGVRANLHRIANDAGVNNVHPHRFRRTLATNLINRGMSIQEVATILGHENINTTMTYIYLDKDNIKNNYKRFY